MDGVALEDPAARLAGELIAVYAGLLDSDVEQTRSTAQELIDAGDPQNALKIMMETMAGALSCEREPESRFLKVTEALMAAEDAAAHFREAGDKRAAALSLQVAANAYLARGDPYAATQRATAAIGLARAADARPLQASIMYTVAGAHLRKAAHHGTVAASAAPAAASAAQQQERELDTALELCGEAVAIFELEDDRRGEAAAWQRLGDVHLAKEEPEEARRACRKSRVIWRELGDEQGDEAATGALVRAHLAGGDLGEALEEAEGACRSARQGGQARAEARALMLLAYVHFHAGDYERCVARSGEAGDIYREAGDLLELVNAMDTCRSARLVQQDYGAAVAQAKGMVDVLSGTSHRRELAGVLHGLAQLQLEMCFMELQEEKRGHAALIGYHSMERESLQTAEDTAKAAVALYREVGDAEGELAVVETMRQASESLTEFVKMYEEPTLTYYVQNRGEKEVQAISVWEIPGEISPDGKEGPPTKIYGARPPKIAAKSK